MTTNSQVLPLLWQLAVNASNQSHQPRRTPPTMLLAVFVYARTVRVITLISDGTSQNRIQDRLLGDGVSQLRNYRDGPEAGTSQSLCSGGIASAANESPRGHDPFQSHAGEH